MIEVKDTPIAGLKVIVPRVFRDDRGQFIQTYHRDIYKSAGITDDFVQDNQAISRRGVLRGLHYQVGPYAQSKLVRITRGSVFDVAVDIRPGSSTYGEWYGMELSGENNLQLYIPSGFAHGYIALEDDTCFCYKCGALYAPEYEGGIRYDDPHIGIDWPELDTPFIVSDRDLGLAKFGNHRV